MTRGRGPLLLALALLASAAAPAPAPVPGEAAPTGTAEDRLRLVQERREALERDLARLRGEEQSLLGEVERLDLEVRLRGEQVREAQLELQRASEELAATVRQVEGLEGQIRAARPALAARARALYKLGDLSYVRLLLSVERPADVFRGYRFVTTLARRDRQRISSFRADLARLAQTRATLEQRQQEAQRLRDQVEQRRQALDGERRTKTDLLTRIVEQKETQAAYVEELQQAEQRLDQLVQGLGEADVSVPLAVLRGTLPWPVDGRVRSGFGRRRRPRFDSYTVQNGIDIECPADTPVAAVHEGTVVFADRFRGYGLMVVIDHGGKHHTLYAHLGETRVEVGQRVSAGEIIGSAGSTGIDGPGLYFELRVQGRAEDPLEWLRPAGRGTPGPRGL